MDKFKTHIQIPIQIYLHIHIQLWLYLIKMVLFMALFLGIIYTHSNNHSDTQLKTHSNIYSDTFYTFLNAYSNKYLLLVILIILVLFLVFCLGVFSAHSATIRPVTLHNSITTLHNPVAIHNSTLYTATTQNHSAIDGNSMLHTLTTRNHSATVQNVTKSITIAPQIISGQTHTDPHSNPSRSAGIHFQTYIQNCSQTYTFKDSYKLQKISIVYYEFNYLYDKLIIIDEPMLIFMEGGYSTSVNLSEYDGTGIKLLGQSRDESDTLYSIKKLIWYRYVPRVNLVFRSMLYLTYEFRIE